METPKKMSLFEDNDSNAMSDEIKVTSKNVKYKDKLFCKIFADKQAKLELYKSLHPEDTTATVDQITDVQLENALVNMRYNDIGFMVDDRLIVLVEQQSSLCYNMPMRLLIYCGYAYDVYVRQNGLILQNICQLRFPKPEFYVVSTRHYKNTVLSIQDAFDSPSEFIDLNVKVIERDEQEHSAIQDYLKFIFSVESNYRYTQNWEASVNMALSEITDNLSYVNQQLLKEGAAMCEYFHRDYTDEEYAELMTNTLNKVANDRAKDMAQDIALKDTIENLLSFSVPKDTIMQRLLKNGYSADKINKVFLELGK